MTSTPERVVRDLFAYENGDESKVDALAESVDVYNPGLPNGEVHSRAEWEAYQRDAEAGFPDFNLQEEELVADGNVVMAEVRITGTHEGEFKGLPPTGREVEIHGMDKFIVENGQIVEWHAFYDTAQLEEQLGLTFPTVVGQLPRLAWGKLRSSL